MSAIIPHALSYLVHPLPLACTMPWAFIVGLTVLLGSQGVYGENGMALPFNGGVYTASINSLTKPKATHPLGISLSHASLHPSCLPAPITPPLCSRFEQCLCPQACVCACFSIMSYIATALVSAASATKYVFGYFEEVDHWVTETAKEGGHRGAMACGRHREGHEGVSRAQGGDSPESISATTCDCSPSS